MKIRQLDILKSGVTIWNDWRDENPNESIDLKQIDLSQSNNAGPNLWDDDLNGANLRGINFSEANLEGAILSGADLGKSNFNKSILRDVNFWETTLTDSNLIHADITNANFTGANLDGAKVSGVIYETRLMHGNFKGIKVDSVSGNAIFKRDAQDQDYLDSVKERISPFWYWVWGFFTDFGRSLLRTFLFGTGWILVFAAFYYLDFYFYHTCIHYRDSATFLTPLYFSFVTFSTLGFGDVFPKNYFGEILVIAEVIIGYMTLGLMVSIFANKLARRA